MNDAPEPLGELDALKVHLRRLIHWRDCLAAELAKVDAELASGARTYATANGDFVKPTLDQLRAVLLTEGSETR